MLRNIPKTKKHSSRIMIKLMLKLANWEPNLNLIPICRRLAWPSNSYDSMVRNSLTYYLNLQHWLGDARQLYFLPTFAYGGLYWSWWIDPPLSFCTVTSTTIPSPPLSSASDIVLFL